MTQSADEAARAPDFAGLRARFPIFERRTYINSCSYGALSLDVQNAIGAYLQSRHEKGSDWNAWIGKAESVRALLAELVNCDADEMALTGSVSESVNNLASAFDFSAGRNEVVLTDLDFPTTSQIWLARERAGARIRRARADESGAAIALAKFDRLISDKTLIVSIPLVCYRNGAMLDVGPIVELARSRGAMVLLDAYQAAGSMRLDVRALGVDFLVGGTLKYLIGGAGVGYCYVRAATKTDLTPVNSGWFAQEDVHAMDIYNNRPSHSARRFESGTPNVPGMYVAEAGLKLLMSVGLDHVRARILSLNADIARRAIRHGWRIVGSADPALRGAMTAIKCADAPALVARLDARAITTSDRDGNLRISPHFYNDLSDIDRLFDALESERALIG
ncbi:MAG: aminotransferase class V-fold PLP-dependent enzyme [Parvularculaceae bacterium]